jgi:hypothetical protein
MMTVGQRKSGTLSRKTTDFISVPIRVKYVCFGIWHREGLDSRLGNSNRLRSISIDSVPDCRSSRLSLLLLFTGGFVELRSHGSDVTR